MVLGADLQKVPGMRFADTATVNLAVPVSRYVSGLVVSEDNSCVCGAAPCAIGLSDRTLPGD